MHLPILAVPGHADDGHHDGMICLSEWKSFFAWASEHGEGEMHLAKAEEAAAKADKSEAVIQERFNARVVKVFQAMDIRHSGELSLPQMELIFGEETHEYWEDMDGETREECSVKFSKACRSVSDPESFCVSIYAYLMCIFDVHIWLSQKSFFNISDPLLNYFCLYVCVLRNIVCEWL